MSVDLNRIKKELKECNKDIEISGLQAKLVSESDMLHWKGEIKGPQGTPYESGKFVIDINLPADYPFVPPKMKFDTQIWHPNISSQSGAICLDILKNEWSPALTIRTALISLQALLSAAEADDPQDAVVAKMYKEDRAKFDQQAKYWTEMYAKGFTDDSAKVKQLMEMGFPEDKAKAALASSGGDENIALEKLLSE